MLLFYEFIYNINYNQNNEIYDTKCISMVSDSTIFKEIMGDLLKWPRSASNLS